MVFVACSGFPVPVSRYWQEFSAVEISETELAMPGPGTVRRWKREAPKGFAFSLLAPKSIALSGFARSSDNAASIDALAKLAKTLGAHAIVLAAPPELLPTRPNRLAVRAYLDTLPPKLPHVVVDLQGWPPDEAQAATKGTDAVLAYNPLAGTTSGSRELAYVRLPGPAGHRSRYEETVLDRVAEHVKASKAEETFCVFCNIDMYANAKRVMSQLG